MKNRFRFRNNSSIYFPFTNRAAEVEYESIPFTDNKLKEFIWEPQTNDFTASDQKEYEVDASAGDIDITLPPISSISFIIIKRVGSLDNELRVISSSASEKIKLANGTTSGLDYKYLPGNKIYLITANSYYEVETINDENYPWDRNFEDKPEFV